MTMRCGFTSTQQGRLAALGVDEVAGKATFETARARNEAFQQLEYVAVARNRATLQRLTSVTREPALRRLERELAHSLHAAGFTEVVTPTIITASQLDRMSIDEENPLHDQVFWTDSKHCLRPMLAPGLYTLSKKLISSTGLPLRVFEIGSCFRRESEGKRHLEEFTMLDLVEWGTPFEQRHSRLEELMRLVLDAADMVGWNLTDDESVIYGQGIDAEDANGLELASSSMGPHRLDAAWGIDCTWVGIGFGLERLLESRESSDNIHRFSHSTTYLDGAVLNIR